MIKKKIVITGGHHNSALLIAEELRKKGYEVIWFGHKHTMWGDKNPGAEYKEVTQAGFKFVEIKAGKIYRTYNLLKLARVPMGFIQSFGYLLKFRPSLIVSFGSFLAAPVVICGWILGIPSITHEQTVVYGLANKAISPFAKKILVSWKTSLSHFPENKVVFTGLPLRPEIFSKNKGKFNFQNKLLTIYISGGKQGAHIINKAVKEILPRLLKKYNLIHQSGGSTLYDDWSSLKAVREKLPNNLQKRYFLKDYILRDEIGQVFAASDLVISRSGAHITYELAALGKPAILVPLPRTSADEQNKNARILARAEIAKILPENELTGENLLKAIDEFTQKISFYQKNAVRAKQLVALGATKKIVDLIEEIINEG